MTTGTPQHQALLKAIVAYYHADGRVLAVSLFGSLARGTWDSYSVLDLDVVMADEVRLDVPQELKQLGAAVAGSDAPDPIIVGDGPEAGDVVLASLLQFSIRYHPLATTSPDIVDNLRVLAGTLSVDTLAAAGRANRRSSGNSLAGLLDKGVRYVAVADVFVQRG